MYFFLFFPTDLWHVHQPLQQLDRRALCPHLQAGRLRQRPAAQRAAVLGEHDGACWYQTVVVYNRQTVVLTVGTSYRENVLVSAACFQVSHSSTLLQRSSASQGSRASTCTVCCTNQATWSPAGSIPLSSLCTVVRRFDLSLDSHCVDLAQKGIWLCLWTLFVFSSRCS